MKTVRRIRLAVLLLLLLAGLLVVANYLDLKKVKRAESLLLQKGGAAAEEVLSGIESSLFHKQSKSELKGLLCFYQGRVNDAQTIFTSMPSANTVINYTRFLQSLADEARYKELQIYLNYLIKRKEEVGLHLAICQSALFDKKASTATLSRFTPANEDEAKIAKLLHSTNQILGKNKIDCIVDTNGQPLAYYDLTQKKTVSVTPGITFSEFTDSLAGGVKYFKLTLDGSLQKKVHQLFGKYHGSFLLMDLSDNSIVVAYSKPLAGNIENGAFCQMYEPGSTTKVLTLLSYFNNSSQSLFPLTCKGNMTIKLKNSNKIFYDWLKHNRVNNYIDALSVSCNVSFARMGLQIGSQKLSATLNQFFFNSPGFKDLFLNFKTGNTTTGTLNDWQTANLSVGLEEIKSTTFHLALVAAAISQNGTIYSPYLIKNIKNVLRLGFFNHQSKVLPVAKSDSTHFIKLKEAMIQVVADRRGTGRRGKVKFMQVAAKTGTAGRKRDGFDAVLLGFFPARKARYSFAFRLERGGKAQVEGAVFLKNFLTTCFKDKGN